MCARENLICFDVPLVCPACGGQRLHHSRLKTWYERVRWHATGRVPWRCEACGARSWHGNEAVAANGLRRVHPELTDTELDGLDPERAEGDRT